VLLVPVVRVMLAMVSAMVDSVALSMDGVDQGPSIVHNDFDWCC